MFLEGCAPGETFRRKTEGRSSTEHTVREVRTRIYHSLPLGSSVGDFRDLEKEQVSAGLGTDVQVSRLLPALHSKA